MANVIRIKRRVTGLAGAPSALKSAELAHNEVDDTLYVGKGDDGSGNATSVIALAGKGAFVDLGNAQTVAGAKTFSTVPKAAQDASGSTDLVRKSQLDTLLAAKAPLASPSLTGMPTAPTATPATNTTQIATTAFVQSALSGVGAGDMLKSVYDTTNNGKVDVAETADAVAWTGVTGKPSSFTPAAHTHLTSEVTGLDTALAAKAPLASPALTGTPTAPTATAGTSSTQLATTAFVAAAVAAVVNGSPGALDTLNELAAALGKVDVAETADAVAWTGVTGKPSSFTPATHTHLTSEVTGLDTALAAKAALASPALTGTPTAPTATAGTSSTQLATTAFVAAAVAAVVNGSPGALDTLNELAAALGNDASFSATVTNSLAGKLAKTSNLSDLSDAAAARTNLGLGTMATQNASAVAITGGSVDGITLDGGTF